MNLTENEIKAMKICLNYTTRESQLNDNFSNGGPQEFMDELNWNAQQVGGLMSSLEKKNMGFADAEFPIFWLTEEGVNALFDIIEGEEAAQE